MKYLISTAETYRVETDAEAVDLIESAKKSPDYSLVKYNSEFKEVKVKGEVVETYYKVTLNKVFCDIKDPEGLVEVKYSIPGVKEDVDDEEVNIRF